MGKPNNVKEALNLVDLILVGDYSTHKKVEKVDNLIEKKLNEVENKIDVEPDEDLKKIHSAIVDELTKDDEVSQLDEDIALSISRLIREEEYREFFKGMMQQYNISSPSELDDERKREFFSAIKNGWAKKKNNK